MTYDIFCCILAAIAFAGGYQKGFIKTFSLIIAVVVALAVTGWSGAFIRAYAQQRVWLTDTRLVLIIMALEAILLIWLFVRFARYIGRDAGRKQGKITLYQQLAGGTMLGLTMLLSLAILTGFFDRSGLLSDQQKSDSWSYRLMSPVSEHAKLWWHEWKATAITADVGALAD